METEIQALLDSSYMNMIIEVHFIRFREYYIDCKTNDFHFDFKYKYDGILTMNENVYKIMAKIDEYILSFYKEGV